MTQTEELKAIRERLDDVERLDVIEQYAGRDKRVRQEVQRLRERRLQIGVRLSVAARLLGLSVPTVRAWAERGTLEDLGGSPRRVSLASVDRLRPVVRELKQLGRDRNLLEAVLARIEDEQTLADPRLKRSLEQMRRGEYAELTPPAE